MPIVTIAQFAALTAVLIIVACVLYQTVKMRDAYTAQRTEVARAMSVIEDVQRIYPELISLLQRLDSSSLAVEGQPAAPQESVSGIDLQEEQAPQQRIPEVAPKQNNESALMRREILSRDPSLRFGVLKDWLAKNSLAIRRRAAHEWKTPADLIAMIPASLEAEAEIVDDRVLLVGT